jgi:predicted RNA-binding Zn ribbon-like protein
MNDDDAEFKLLAGHAVLDFVNTLDWRFRESGAQELLNSYADLLRFASQSRLLDLKQAAGLTERTSSGAGESVLTSARELREALSAAFYSGLDGQGTTAAARRTLEQNFQAAQLQQKLVTNGSHLVWSWADAEDKAEFPLWLLAISGVQLLTSEAVQLIRACGAAECRWLFLDTSKNHTRRWCDMKICGNRMKARRFKAQRGSEHPVV